uniref:Uncharacterized protein n=1 Tax=Picea sitchensis TaxID=3332 RepID=D5AD01_PICSI|nr:unknown [Picea sitchensis]
MGLLPYQPRVGTWGRTLLHKGCGLSFLVIFQLSIILSSSGVIFCHEQGCRTQPFLLLWCDLQAALNIVCIKVT